MLSAKIFYHHIVAYHKSLVLFGRILRTTQYSAVIKVMEPLHPAVNKKLISLPKNRVELHAHLDGCVRAETIWELSKEKNLPMPGIGTFRDFRDALIVRDPIDLGHFLAPFAFILPAIQDDRAALERIGYEFIEDKAKQNVAYVEARFSPHGLLSEKNRDLPHLQQVIDSIAFGLRRGGEDYGVDSRIILCTLIGDNTAEETLKLCEMTKDLGVVAIDTASKFDKSRNTDEVPKGGIEQAVFQRAKEVGIHRTVHAGERGPPQMVSRAVELYGAERIGHGYHVVEDPKIYADTLNKRIHFECCPWSSFLTGAVPMGVTKHPIVRFAEDKANFSINTDDTAITGYDLSDDYKLFQTWSVTEADAVRASLNAAKSSFLPEIEKEKLIKRIMDNISPE